MNECYADLTHKTDAQLDALYNKLLANLAGLKSQMRLRASQAAWVTYRDRECNFIAAGTEGGSIQPTIADECFISLTENRIKEFQAQLNCAEGDLTCAAGAPYIWDGEWDSGTTAMITVIHNKANAFYWKDDYRSVGDSHLSPDSSRLTFTWESGTVSLQLSSETSAKAVIREKGHPDVTTTLTHR